VVSVPFARAMQVSGTTSVECGSVIFALGVARPPHIQYHSPRETDMSGPIEKILELADKNSDTWKGASQYLMMGGLI